MKVMALRYLKTLFILLFAVFFSWQTALAQDPLTFEGEPAEVVFEDGTYKFIPEVKGGDGIYTFDYLGEPDWMEVTVVNGEDGSVTLKNKDGRPNNADVDILPDTPIKIWVTDGTGTQIFLPDFKVTVKNVNDPPVINEKGYTDEDEDPFRIITLNQLQILDGDTAEKTILYEMNVTDDDLDLKNLNPPEELTFPNIGLPDWLEYADGDGIPTLFNKEGRPDNSDVGEHEIILRAIDNNGQTDSINIRLVVSNVNDPPSVAFDPLPESEVNQDAEWSATFKGADVDFDLNENEALTFSVDIYKLEGEDYLLKQTLIDKADPVENFWLDSIKDPDTDSTVRTLSGTPKDDDVGKYKIILKVTDAANLQSVSATVEEAFMLEVVNVNDPPTITIEDGYVTALDQASIDNGSVAPGFAFSIKPTVGDVDEEDVLTLSARNLPDWMEFVDTDDDLMPDTLRNKEDRPNNEDAGGAAEGTGTYSEIQLCVDDYTDDSTDPVCEELSDIIVTNKNDIPVVNVEEKPPSVVYQAYFGKETVNPGASFNFKPDINDPDGNPLTVTVKGDIPDWLEFVDNTLRNKENRPNNDDSEVSSSLSICANDTAQEVCTDTYTIKVENVNDPPTLTTEKPLSNVDQSYGTCCVVDPEDPDSLLPVAQGDIINFAVQLNDIDDEFPNLKCFMDNKPAWLELITVQDSETSETNYFMVNSENRPANSDVGIYTGIKICASDEKADPVCTEEFTITVNNVNDPPTIKTVIADINVDQVIEDTPEGDYTYPGEYDQFEVNDPDLELENTQEALDYHFEKGKPDWMDSQKIDNKFTIYNKENRPNQQDVGVFEEFNICVKDKDGEFSCTNTVKVTVVNVNDPPVITPATDNDPVTSVEFGGTYSSSFLIGDIDEGDVLFAWIDEDTTPPPPLWLELTMSDDKTTVTLEGKPEGQDIIDIYENVTIAVNDGKDTTRYSFNIQVVTPTPGDINYDGSIDITDAVLALQILAGLTPDNAYMSGDVNGDDKISIQDVLYILRMIALQPSNISAALAKNLIDTTSDLVIIDVSTMYDQGHLPLARNYPVNDGTLANEIPNLNKNGQYLVYCHSDIASLKATQMLLAEGFQTVYRLEGNYDAWADAGYLIDISAATAKELIDSSTDEELIVIDVASSNEYVGGHIPGASTYPLSEDALDNVIPNLSKEKKYLVYCRSDESSVIGGNKLVEAGFKPVYRLSGNFDAWKAAGYEIEPEPEP
ncbi:MAG: hypothetical protein GY795_21190 [Desulfobacterales bacterium]|nr:hypothetical protein [Desulfobacterales bacterium]